MSSFVSLTGNLVHDPSVARDDGGRLRVKMWVALNHRWTTAAGEQRENVAFVPVVSWGTTAEACELLSKSDRVMVSGRLRQRRDQDGNNVIEVHANSVAKGIFND